MPSSGSSLIPTSSGLPLITGGEIRRANRSVSLAALRSQMVLEQSVAKAQALTDVASVCVLGAATVASVGDTAVQAMPASEVYVEHVVRAAAVELANLVKRTREDLG